MKRIICLVCVLCGLTTIQARQRQNFDADWLFVLADSVQMAEVNYNDASWRRLDVPHDWAIEGDFYAGNPSGAGGGALPGGIGWYRKHFNLGDCETNMKETKFFLEFDGVYMNSTVYINGQKVGYRPYGYSSFEYDITPYVKEGENVVAVRVDNSDQPNSRWYSGCGIYRHVWLTKTAPIHVAHWGVYANSSVTKGKGRLAIEVELMGTGPVSSVPVIQNTLIDPHGRVVGKSKGLKSVINVSKPMLWSCETPNIYKVRTEVIQGGKIVDTYETITGFRDFKFDAKTGFWLNGKNMKLNGVCEHHDFGCLGAAHNEDALHRKLTKLKAMGVNSIRSSHNPPAPERDRNHPCILMWSIGNEVLEQWSSTDADELTLEQANLLLNAARDASTLAKDGELSPNSLLTIHLADIVKRYDTSRPITAGCNEPSPNNHLFKSGAIDLIGFNYHHEWVKDVPKNFPDKPFIFSESVSALQTRDFYRMPSDTVYKAPKQWWLPYTDPSFMCSAYDNMHASWSSTHEETWDVVKHNDFVGGQYIWTGFDYIGEPTPYGFPARSSYFGIIDLAGFPKDTYYMYQSEWTDKPVLHLFPHWNWVAGDYIDMWCYYSGADEVELFINGKSQGVRKKTEHTAEGWKQGLCTEYHVGWRVTFDPGEVKAVSRKDGKVVCEQTIRTAGPPAKIRLSKDYQGKNTTFITAEVVDKDGNLCPWADDLIYFIGEGDGRILGTDNGCQTSMERFTSPQRHAFHGKCMAVVTGNGSITAKSPTLEPTWIEFTVSQ